MAQDTTGCTLHTPNHNNIYWWHKCTTSRHHNDCTQQVTKAYSHFAYRAISHAWLLAATCFFWNYKCFTWGGLRNSRSSGIDHQYATLMSPNQGKTAVCGAHQCGCLWLFHPLLDDWGGDHWLPQIGLCAPLAIVLVLLTWSGGIITSVSILPYSLSLQFNVCGSVWYKLYMGMCRPGERQWLSGKNVGLKYPVRLFSNNDGQCKVLSQQ